MPPDSSAGNLSPSSALSPTISSLALASSSSSRSERCRFSRIGNCTFWRAVSEENSAPCWNRMPQRRPIAELSCGSARSRSMPSTSMLPARLGSRPMMVRNSTDLPPPDAPTRPRISPAPHVEREMVEHDLIAESDHEVAHPDRHRLARRDPSVTFRSRRRRWRTRRRARSPGRSISPRTWWSAGRAIRRCLSPAGPRCRPRRRSPAP